MRRFSILLAAVAACIVLHGTQPARSAIADAHSTILAGDYDGTFDGIEVVNFLVGADIFYASGYFGQRTIIANVEAGHVWGGHEVFDRSGLGLPSPPMLLVNQTPNPVSSPQLGELDFHATMVGHVLAGTGHVGGGSLSLLGAGMAPLATLWSGAIATTFDTEDIGAFDISRESFLVPYKAFFKGESGGKADVVNSSWGFTDLAGNSEETRIIDALARENPTVTFVAAAGNDGAGDSRVGGPASGYNGISVGALTGSGDADPFLRHADFSSSQPADFYNPVTGVTIPKARAAVDISAPATQLALAYYGGKSGSLSELVGAGNPADDLYFTFNQGGTSFSAPVVAGGVALLKDVSYGGFYLAGQPEARDTRVIKSVLMAGAERTIGWSNGQQTIDGVITTTQALDYATGAGRMDLTASAGIYLFGTTDVPGLDGGVIDLMGWDLGVVALGGVNDYQFDLSFNGPVEMTLSLNWFVNRIYDATADLGTDSSFADLNLEVWSVTNGAFDALLATSMSLYNNGEFLRFTLEAAGYYGLRVTFDQAAYDLTGMLDRETYALAWNVVSVPEPRWAATFVALAIIAMVARRRFVLAARSDASKTSIGFSWLSSIRSTICSHWKTGFHRWQARNEQ